MVRACIEGKIAGGVIDGERGQQMLDMLDQLEVSYREKLSPEMAQIKAATDMVDLQKQKAKRTRYLNSKQIIALDRIDRQVFSHSGGVVAGGHSLLDIDLSRKGLQNANVTTQRGTILKHVSSMFFGGLNALERTGLGWKTQRATGEAIVRALHGEKVSKAAMEIAEQWKKASEYLRTRFNAAGGNIGKWESWLLPQSHDMRKIGEVSVDVWKKHILPLLDRQKMVDLDTGLPVGDEKLELLLHDIYETLRTDGINKLKPGGQRGKSMLANQRGDHRILHFKDAESWLTYQKRFGNDDIFNTLTNHMERMSQDIAMMEVMGPNPEHGFKRIMDHARKEAAALPGGKGLYNKRQRAESKIDGLQTTWDTVTGLNSTPVNGRIATIGSELRAWQASSHLGSAYLSAYSDFGTASMIAKLNKMKPTKMLNEYMKVMKDNDYREFAAQMGVVADSLTQTMASGHRYAGEMLSHGFMSRVADSVMRVSLLKPHTDGIQMAFQMEFLGMLGRHLDKSFDQLDEGLIANFKNYGIGKEHWSMMQKAYREKGGARYVDPMAMARLDTPNAQEAAEQLQRMMLTEREYAVITSHSRVRGWMFGNNRPGTGKGEAFRAFWHFKNFPLTFTVMHMTRMLSQNGIQGKIAYGTGMAFIMMLFGMVSLQSKQVKGGKDLRDLSSGETWGEAMLQGGGLGIFGDFIGSDANRNGGTFLGTFSGPLVGQTGDAAWRLIKGNFDQAAAGEKLNLAYEAWRFTKSNIPFQNLWYTQLLFERGVADRIDEFVDPKVHRRRRRMIRKMRKEYGQDYFWRPGATAPRRAPEMEERR